MLLTKVRLELGLGLSWVRVWSGFGQGLVRVGFDLGEVRVRLVYTKTIIPIFPICLGYFVTKIVLTCCDKKLSLEQFIQTVKG